MDVADDADDFAPIIFCADANALAERLRRIAPIFPREIFRNQSHGNPLVSISPSQVASRNQRSAHRRRKAGGDELKPAQRRKLALGVGAAFNKNGIVPSASAHGDYRADARRRDARNRLEPVQDVLFHAHDAFRFFDLRVRDGDAESLQSVRLREAGIHFSQGSKRSNH